MATSDNRRVRTFVIEPVYSVDTGTLVVSAQDEEVLRVLDFVCEKETYGFQGLFTAIDVVSQEQVVGFWREAAVLE